MALMPLNYLNSDIGYSVVQGDPRETMTTYACDGITRDFRLVGRPIRVEINGTLLQPGEDWLFDNDYLLLTRTPGPGMYLLVTTLPDYYRNPTTGSDMFRNLASEIQSPEPMRLTMLGTLDISQQLAAEQLATLGIVPPQEQPPKRKGRVIVCE
jgi:hypothetical protein